MKYKRPSLIHPEADQVVPGFDFTKDDFEDLIDNFTPFEDIPSVLFCSMTEMDKFCMLVYRMDYKDTYDVLLKRSNIYYRKAMFMLSKAGNNTAIKLTAEHYVGLGAIDKQEERITFVGIMPKSESDAEKLSKAISDLKEEI